MSHDHGNIFMDVPINHVHVYMWLVVYEWWHWGNAQGLFQDFGQGKWCPCANLIVNSHVISSNHHSNKVTTTLLNMGTSLSKLGSMTSDFEN